MKLLFIGDVVGRPGRQAVERRLGRLIDRHYVDFVVANGENAAAGFGLTLDTARDLFDVGIDVLTTGNHIWDKREIYSYLNEQSRLLRPANYPPGAPGTGCGLYQTSAGIKVGVINLEGRIFMSPLDCPFRAADELIKKLRQQTNLILVDFHAEATSEKMALAHYLDGRVSAVVGTHTHVQTADEQILPGGTAYLTDAGMTGAVDSVIGICKEIAVGKFLTQLPARFEVAKKSPMINGVLFDLDERSGRAIGVERVRELVD